MKKAAFAALTGLALLFPQPAGAEDHAPLVADYVRANILPWLSDALIIDTLRERNGEHSALTQADIDALDKRWRAETEADSRLLIDAVLGNRLSAHLASRQDAAKGMITELFVMDNRGLNAGQSGITSDYWQGDEAKWQKSFGAGPDAIFVDDIEVDESTQTLQAQANITISDPATGQPIGAITVGINVDEL